MKCRIIKNNIMHKVVIIKDPGDRQTRVYDNSIQERIDKSEWNIYYKNHALLYSLIGEHYIDRSHTLVYSLTLSRQMDWEKFNKAINNYKYNMRLMGFSHLMDCDIMVKGIQPDTGNYHTHGTYLRRNKDISIAEYRKAMEICWAPYGSVSCEKIRWNKTIYNVIEYMSGHLRPNSDQYIKPIERYNTYRVTFTKGLAKTEIEIVNAIDVFIRQEDILATTWHRIRNYNTTITVRPNSKVEFVYKE